jgi:hypothetical protein
MSQREDDHARLMAECLRLMAENEQLAQAIAAARRELLLYAGDDEEDWDAGVRDAMAQMQAAAKARTP